jgi:NAD(P)-dependent dehydrogenase (short-subunit alcohol dehydrogenase family)
MELKDRIAIVTGPAKGMGAAISTALAREGANLVLAGRDVAAIEPVAAEITALGRRALIVACDVTSEPDIAAMTAQALAFGDGRIDILVNVAGGSGPIETLSWKTTPDEFDQIVELNMKGCFLTMRAVLPTMTAQNHGKIVNIGGTFGLRGRALRMAYSASKWGLRGITKSAALEAGPFNININTVCPGMVEGPRFDRVCRENARRLDISVDEARRRHAEEYALRRVSTGDDVANAVVFLVSERARQITGQDIAVDGGWVI